MSFDRGLVKCARLIVSFVIALLASVLFTGPLVAQDRSALPNAPDSQAPSLPSSDAAAQSPAPGASSTISGTVVDRNGAVVQGAHVALSKQGAQAALRTSTSTATGAFAFEGLEPGVYTVTISGDGMSTFVSQPIALQAGQPVIVPNAVLNVAGITTSVTVMDKEQASIEQVKIAEQQRVLKVFPNFYSSFDPNAPPILAKQKYGLAARTLIDPVTLLITGAIAGAEQQQDIFPSFGGGIEGYGKRYGAAYADHASSELFTRAVFPSIFHTDPRYFIQGTGSTRDRAMHAVTSTFVTRGDNGKRRINFPEILGELSAAALSNAYFPEQERGVHLVLINGLGGLGGNMLDNVLREFLLNRITTRAKH